MNTLFWMKPFIPQGKRIRCAISLRWPEAELLRDNGNQSHLHHLSTGLYHFTTIGIHQIPYFSFFLMYLFFVCLLTNLFICILPLFKKDFFWIIYLFIHRDMYERLVGLAEGVMGVEKSKRFVSISFKNWLWNKTGQALLARGIAEVIILNQHLITYNITASY